MKRKIITINEEKCTGCGVCIPDCPEGALQIIDGKARLISDLFCDGLGACIGTCPEGAISVIEREAAPYDEKSVMENIVRQGQGVIAAHLDHLIGHGEKGLYHQALEFLKEKYISVPPHKNVPVGSDRPDSGSHPFVGCPGAMARSIQRDHQKPGHQMEQTESELRQWPIQLALLTPAAGYFDGADLLIAADCTPFAYADFHRDFLAGKILIMFCPKLDSDIEGYIAKLSEIFTRHRIKSVTLVHMEVPCCSGVGYVFRQALKKAGTEIPAHEITISIQGQIKK